jgi:DNA-binding transcriptional MerR regulator
MHSTLQALGIVLSDEVYNLMGIALCLDLCEDGGMAHDTSRLQSIGAERAQLAARLKEITPGFHEEIFAALDAGIGPVEVARQAGISRDAVAQLVRKRDAANT